MFNKFAILLLGLAIYNQADASYFSDCGLGSGEEICNRKVCSPLVVRPQELPKPPVPMIKVPAPPMLVPLPALPPLGGPCVCKKAIVKPAIVPRPVCQTCRRNQCSRGYNIAEQNIYNGYNADLPCQRAVIRGESLPPADPVSLAIALNMAKKSCRNDEDYLNFGFRQLPKNAPPRQIRKNYIPEENLYGLNGQILELKPIGCKKSLEEEAAEQLLDLSEEEHAGNGVRELSLKELGYGPAKLNPATLVNVPAGAEVNPLDAVPLCNDGFVPGNVVIKEIPKYEPVYDSPIYRESEEIDIPSAPLVPLLPPAPAYGCGCCSSYLTRKSHKSHSSSMLLHKLTCE